MGHAHNCQQYTAPSLLLARVALLCLSHVDSDAAKLDIMQSVSHDCQVQVDPQRGSEVRVPFADFSAERALQVNGQDRLTLR